jgi:hypothetical protein
MPAGQLISYSATLPLKRVVTDRIIMTDPMEIVAINALGLDNESKFNFVNGPAAGGTYEWLQDTLQDRTDALNTAGLTSDSTSTGITVDNATQFQVGDVILVDSEYMWVSSISGSILTVTRNYGGTQATHSDDAVVTLVSRARIEGTNSNDSNFTQPTSGTNYSQIFHKEIDVSRSNALLQRYGIPNVVEREVDKAMAELVRLLNLTAYHGQRKVGSSSTPRGMGGLDTFITTNINALSSTPALTRKHIEDEIQDAWNAGGNPRLILCGAWAKRKIASFFEGYVQTERSEKMGGIEIDRIMSPLGLSLSVAVDRFCPTNKLYILDPDYAGYLTIDPFFEESLGKVGDTAYFGQVVGEYGFVVAFETAHSIVSGFSTSA